MLLQVAHTWEAMGKNVKLLKVFLLFFRIALVYSQGKWYPAPKLKVVLELFKYLIKEIREAVSRQIAAIGLEENYG